jgi:hypothetical protein
MHIDFDQLKFETKNIPNKNNIWTENEERFKSQLTAKVPKQATLTGGGAKLTITVEAFTDDMSKATTLYILAMGLSFLFF